MLTGIKAVAFDLDGTLYPNYRLNIRLIPFIAIHWPLLAAFGWARDIIRREQEQFPAVVNPAFYDYQAQLTAKKLNRQWEQVRDTLERLMYRGWEPHFLKIQLYPHVVELLDALKKASFKLGILSDFPPETKIKNLGIDSCWDAVLCSEAIGALKPAAPPFTALAAALDCRPEEVLYVGNSRRYDVAGARRAGMKTALLTGRFRAKKTAAGKIQADFIFSNYRQLFDFVLQ